jgi:hypothetical protein
MCFTKTFHINKGLIMFWAIVLIGAGLGSTSVTYVGQFEQQEICAKAAQEFKAQGMKAACVQVKK